MAGRQRLGIPDALYLRPLIQGLERSDRFELHLDIPAKLAVDFRERPDFLRGAFLSPLDYARHGGNYQILPGYCAASSQSTGTIRLLVNPDRRNITTMAVDVRVTSEIVLAKIILVEKFPNLPRETDSLAVIPMAPRAETMLGKADAALVISFEPEDHPAGVFSIDLVEEWNEMTGLPYVHGFWVVREDEFSDADLRALLAAEQHGTALISSDPLGLAANRPMNRESLSRYFSSFSYGMTDTHTESISEYFRYAFYHGVLGDIPDLNFFSLSPPAGPSIH